MPLLDLVGVAYAINIISDINKENILKTLIGTISYYGFSFYAGTYIAPIYTKTAAPTNEIALPEGYITSLNTLCKPILLIITYPFIKASFIGILIVVSIYFLIFFLIKK